VVALGEGFTATAFEGFSDVSAWPKLKDFLRDWTAFAKSNSVSFSTMGMAIWLTSSPAKAGDPVFQNAYAQPPTLWNTGSPVECSFRTEQESGR